jgi:antitoxin component of MazEF toxin-antitoxin module
MRYVYSIPGSKMKHVNIRRFGNSLYVRIPKEWTIANNLKNDDLAFLTLVDGRTDKYEVILTKLPIPPELKEPEPQSQAMDVTPDQAAQEAV